MFGSTTLEVAIGVIFVFVLFSTVCAAFREAVEAVLKTRAAYLEYGIRELLDDRGGKGLANDLFNHPLIAGLFVGNYAPAAFPLKPRILAAGKNLPSYIPARIFATALLDLAAQDSARKRSAKLSIDILRENISVMSNSKVARILDVAIDHADGDLDKVITNIEAWYDSAMDRVSGWYKRSTSYFVFYSALALAVFMNVNTIVIAEHLYRTEATRAVFVDLATKMPAHPDAVQRDQVVSQLEKIRLPIGWNDGPYEFNPLDAAWWTLMPGWIATALAATLGAPFWFDTLNRVMVVRSTVKPHEKSPEEASEDK